MSEAVAGDKQAIATQAAPRAIGPYSQAVAAGGLLFCSGQIGLDPATVSSADQGAIIKEVRQRCRHCASEDVCERWLAGSQPGEDPD